jgi:hypothetical protein
MTKEEFYIILHKEEKDCDGADLHLRNLWKNNNAKSLFYITGIDFSNMFPKETLYDTWKEINGRP